MSALLPALERTWNWVVRYPASWPWTISLQYPVRCLHPTTLLITVLSSGAFFQHGPRPLDFDAIYDPPVGTLDSTDGISLNATATGFEGPGQFMFRTFPASSFLVAITVEADGTASWFLGGEVFPDGTPGGAGMFEAVSIPEPPTVILLIFGLLTTLLFSRHKLTHRL